MSKEKAEETSLVCLECGDIFNIQRRRSKLKQVGHIKHLYCINCGKVQPHYEIKDIKEFLWICVNSDYSKLDEYTKKVLVFLGDSERIERETGRIYKK